MLTPTFRPAVALLAGFALALAGCGQPPAAPSSGPAGDTKGGAGTTPPAATGAAVAVAQADPRQAAAQAFVTALVAGKAEPDLLTPAFSKALGEPVVAKAWLARAGEKLMGIAPPDGTAAADGSATFVGPAGNGKGRYLVRVSGGAPKIDWFVIGTADEKTPPPKAATADEAAQDFVVLGFLDAMTGTAIDSEDRAPLLAALMSPGHRGKVASPFDADRTRGEDYNRAKLATLFDGIGGGATEFTRTRTAADRFKAVITKGGSPRTFAIKLTRAAGGWVVDEFQPE